MDQSKKTMRHFYCRDALWETFEAMANDFDCSIDYLINESMRLYARSKNYTVPAGGPPSQIASAVSPARRKCLRTSPTRVWRTPWPAASPTKASPSWPSSCAVGRVWPPASSAAR